MDEVPGGYDDRDLLDDAFSDEVFRNVAGLKKRLRETEKSLQMLRTPRRRTDHLQDDAQDYSPHFNPSPLHQVQHGASLLSSPHGPHYGREVDLLRRKLRQSNEENSLLLQENGRLIKEVEDRDHELNRSKSQLYLVCKQLDSREGGVSGLFKRIEYLQDEIKARDAALRAAEGELESNLSRMKGCERLLSNSREESLKEERELQEEMRINRRLENQRDELNQKLVELTKQMTSYRYKMEEKIKECQEAEQHLRDKLHHCDKEREELLQRATALDQELQNQREQMRLVEESHAQQLKDYEKKIERSHKELGGLRDLTSHMQERMRFTQRSSAVGSDSGLSTISHAMARQTIQSVTPESLRRLSEVEETSRSSGSGEADDEDDDGPKKSSARMRTGLNLAESQLQPCISQSPHQEAINGLRKELAAVVEKSRIDTKKVEHLHSIINQLEQSRGRQRLTLQGLQEEMTELKEDKQSLERRCGLRDNQFRQLQRDLEEREAVVQKVKSENTKKDEQILDLQNQLEKLAAEISGIKKSEEELESSLMKKSQEVSHAEELLTQREAELKDCQESLDRNQQLGKEQCDELQRQIDTFEEERESLEAKLSDFEKIKQRLKHEINEKTGHIGHLEKNIRDMSEELKKKDAEYELSRDTLKRHMEEGWSKVSQLETALDYGREELTSLQKQLKEEKDRHALELNSKSLEVTKLEKQLENISRDVAERARQISELEKTLEDHQQMLQQSTARINELEEREGQLQQQVFNLERDLTKLKSLALEETEAMDKKLQQVSQDLADKIRLLKDTSTKLRQSQDELGDKEKELNDMETILQSSQAELEQRTNQVGQFDQAIKEYQKQQKATVESLQNQVHKTQRDLQEKIKQIAKLEQTLTQTQQSLQSELRSSQDLREQVENQTKQLNQKSDEIKGLTVSLKKLEVAKSQGMEQHSELTECRRLLMEAQQEQDRLSKELDETLQACQTKDAECARLSEELGIAKVKEVKVQSHYSAEVRQVAHQQRLMLENKEEELAKLHSEHSKLRSILEEKEEMLSMENKRLKDSESELKEQIQKLQDALVASREEGAAREQVLHAANEALFIKESEVTRLNARISGFERAITTLGSPHTPHRHSQTYGSPSVSPSHHLMTQPSAGQFTPLRRSNSEILLPSYHSESDDPVPDMTPVRGVQHFHDQTRLTPKSAINSSLPNRESTNHKQELTDFPRDISPEGACPENINHSPFSASSTTSSIQFASLPPLRGIPNLAHSEDLTDFSEKDSNYESLGGATAESFQSMLEYVNRKIAEEEKQLSHLQGQLVENRRLSHSKFLERTGTTPSPYNPDRPLNSSSTRISSNQLINSSVSLPSKSYHKLKSAPTTPAHAQVSTDRTQETLPFIASLLENGSSPVSYHSFDETGMLHFPRGNDTLPSSVSQGDIKQDKPKEAARKGKSKGGNDSQKNAVQARGTRVISRSVQPKKPSGDNTSSKRKNVSRQLFSGSQKGSAVSKKESKGGKR